jgi:hypothetical protein
MSVLLVTLTTGTRGTPSLVLPEVLRRLYVERKTGMLHLSCGSERVSFRFIRGEIVTGYSSSKRTRLGETMVRHGLLALDDLVRALVVVHRDKKKLGPVLKEMGLVDDRGLERALLLHRREMLLTALGWEETEHEFEKHDQSGDRREDPAPVSPTRELILDVVRRIDDRQMVRLGLGSLDRVPVPVIEARVSRDQVALNASEDYVLSKVDGWLTARSIVDASTLPAESVERALLCLLCAGLVEYLPEAPRKAAAPVATYTH